LCQPPPPLRDKQEVRSFLRFCTNKRRFIAGYADIVNLLTQPTKEMRTYQWYPEAETAF
jgi:hypothetical protein